MRRPRSFALFSAFYPPHLGGIENYTQNLARSLAARGNQVVVVTNETQGAAAGVSQEDDIEVVRLPCHEFVSGRLPIARRNRLFRELWSRLESKDFDGILVNARFYPHSLLGVAFAKRHGKRAVLLDHSSGYLSINSALFDSIIKAYEEAITLLGKRYDPAYYGVSGRCVEWLSHFGIKAEGVISNSIDAREYRACSSGRDFRRELSLPSGAMVVVFVGRLLVDKGIPSLIEASINECVRQRGVVVVIAGEGPLSGEVRDAQSSTLKWMGRISREDASALFQQADVMCLPTSYPEGFPTTMLEAAACGCPSVVTDVGGARELIPDESYGCVLPDASPRSVIETLCRLADDRGELKRMGERSQKRVEELFSWDASAEAFERACAAANAESPMRF